MGLTLQELRHWALVGPVLRVANVQMATRLSDVGHDPDSETEAACFCKPGCIMNEGGDADKLGRDASGRRDCPCLIKIMSSQYDRARLFHGSMRGHRPRLRRRSLRACGTVNTWFGFRRPISRNAVPVPQPTKQRHRGYWPARGALDGFVRQRSECWGWWRKSAGLITRASLAARPSPQPRLRIPWLGEIRRIGVQRVKRSGQSRL